MSFCQFSCHGEVGEGKQTEAHVCIVYLSRAFSHQLWNLKAADSQHRCCSQNDFWTETEIIFSPGLTFFQIAAYLLKPHITSAVSLSLLFFCREGDIMIFQFLYNTSCPQPFSWAIKAAHCPCESFKSFRSVSMFTIFILLLLLMLQAMRG